MDELVLADIQALAASPDYGGRGFLQPSSAVLGLSAALFLDDLSLWRGAGYKLTDGEIDDIKAMIAQLEEDLMVTGAMYPIYKAKATNSIAQSITNATWTQVALDTDVYDSEGMHSEGGANSRMNILSDGLYLFSSHITWIPNVLGERRIYLRKYDAELATTVNVMQHLESALPASWYMSRNVIFQDNAKEGDYYWLELYQNSGGNLSLLGGSHYLDFAVVRL